MEIERSDVDAQELYRRRQQQRRVPAPLPQRYLDQVWQLWQLLLFNTTPGHYSSYEPLN